MLNSVRAAASSGASGIHDVSKLDFFRAAVWFCGSDGDALPLATDTWGAVERGDPGPAAEFLSIGAEASGTGRTAHTPAAKWAAAHAAAAEAERLAEAAASSGVSAPEPSDGPASKKARTEHQQPAGPQP